MLEYVVSGQVSTVRTASITSTSGK